MSLEIGDAVKEYLTENLSLWISETDKGICKKIRIKIKLEDETIAEDWFEVQDG